MIGDSWFRIVLFFVFWLVRCWFCLVWLEIRLGGISRFSFVFCGFLFLVDYIGCVYILVLGVLIKVEVFKIFGSLGLKLVYD